jgi:hypothetical protein
VAADGGDSLPFMAAIASTVDVGTFWAWALERAVGRTHGLAHLAAVVLVERDNPSPPLADEPVAQYEDLGH